MREHLNTMYIHNFAPLHIRKLSSYIQEMEWNGYMNIHT